jgi:hypothetical protein
VKLKRGVVECIEGLAGVALGHYVDFEPQQRIPKLSAEWFRVASRQNAVV